MKDPFIREHVQSDIAVEDHGTIVLLRPLSEAGACAPVRDAIEHQGTVKPTWRRTRAVHYRVCDRPLCRDASRLSWKTTTRREKVTCRSCIRSLDAPARPLPIRRYGPPQTIGETIEWLGELNAKVDQDAAERRARDFGPPRLLP